MARLGTFGEDQTPRGWFGDDASPTGWFDDDLTPAVAPSVTAASGSYAMVGFAVALKKTSLIAAASASFALSGGGGAPTGALIFNNSNTKCESTTASLDSTSHSVVMWFKASSPSNLGRFFVLGNSNEQLKAFWNSGFVEVQRVFSVTDGGWTVSPPSSWSDDTTWIGLGITYDGSSTTNSPVVWARRLGTDSAVVSQTVSLGTTPVGTANAVANGYNIGNRPDGTRCFDGDIAFVQIWPGTILTEAQINDALNSPLTFGSPALRLALTSDGTDSSGNGYNATITNGAFGSGPPGIPEGGGASWTNLKVGRKVQAAQGTFALSGQAATLTHDTGPAFIAAGQGTYTETGIAASLRVARRMIAGPASSVADIASADFNDGTPGDFDFLGTPGPVDYPNDPTGSGRGKVNRILYSPGAGLASHDVAMEKTTAYHYRYGERIWFRGEVWIPSTISDGVTTKTAQQDDNTRKLVDYFTGGSPHTRFILATKGDYQLHYSIAQLEAGVWAIDVRDDPIPGLFLTPDTWNQIEVMLLPNSADGVSDGALEIYLNNPSGTPDFRLDTGLSMISDGVDGGTTDEQALFDLGGSYFNSFRFGTQLTTDAGQAAYSEYRYWDNVGVSTTRIGVGFNLYGQSVGFSTGKRLAAAQGAYTETGQPAALKAARTLTLANGSFTETGQAANLRAGRKLPAGFGSYVETGNDASLIRGGNIILAGSFGSFTQTGTAATLRATRIVVALPASYSSTGIAANLKPAFKVVASTGAFVASGQDARLAATRRVTALQGSYTETGQVALLFFARRIAATTGTFVLTGPATGLIHFSQAGTTVFTGELSVAPRFSGALSVTSRFGGAVSISPRFDGEFTVRPA